jgi:hypothetical protein
MVIQQTFTERQERAAVGTCIAHESDPRAWCDDRGDCRLIGEGCLHLVTLAKMRLLYPNAIMLPMGATVYAQPIQMRVDDVRGFDFAQANRYRWRSEYEGVELGECRELWKPLAEPVEVFCFDFYDMQVRKRGRVRAQRRKGIWKAGSRGRTVAYVGDDRLLRPT